MDNSQNDRQQKAFVGRPPRIVYVIALASAAAIVAVISCGVLDRDVHRDDAAARSGEGIPWRTNLSAALAESKQTGKPVLVDFSATWCAPCQAMKREVWPDPQVGQVIRSGYIPVALDVDQADGQEPAAHYEVRSIPAILVVDGNGKIQRREGFMTRERLLEFLGAGKSAG